MDEKTGKSLSQLLPKIVPLHGGKRELPFPALPNLRILPMENPGIYAFAAT
jgi:hypothetical protein